MSNDSDSIRYFKAHQDIDMCVAYIEHLGDLKPNDLGSSGIYINNLDTVANNYVSSINDKLKGLPKQFKLTDSQNVLLNKIFKIIEKNAI